MAKINETRKIIVLFVAAVLGITCTGCLSEFDDDVNTADPILERVSGAIVFFENAQLPSGEICDPENSMFDFIDCIYDLCLGITQPYAFVKSFID